MKVKIKSLIKAVIALILLTALPLVLPSLLPSEFFNAISMQGGIDIGDLLNRVAVLGVVLAILIVLKGSVEKDSQGGLATSISWKVFLLMTVIFILSIGKIENMGLAVLSSESSNTSNIVVLDLRLIVVLTTAIVALLTVRSVLEFNESHKSST
jgi:hypothetical protein